MKMKKNETFGEQIVREMEESPRLKKLVYQEMLLLDIKEKLLEKLEEKKMSAVKLASSMGIPPSELNRMLNGIDPFNVRFISDIFLALGYKVYFDLEEVH